MSLEPGQVFGVMAAAYRHGVLDKSMPLLGELLDGVLADTGLDMGDLVNSLDEAGEETVSRLDALFRRSGPLLRVARSDRLMAFASRALDSPLISRLAVKSLKGRLIKAVRKEGQAVTGIVAPGATLPEDDTHKVVRP